MIATRHARPTPAPAPASTGVLLPDDFLPTSAEGSGQSGSLFARPVAHAVQFVPVPSHARHCGAHVTRHRGGLSNPALHVTQFVGSENDAHVAHCAAQALAAHDGAETPALAQVTQLSGVPEHVAHLESHAVHAYLPVEKKPGLHAQLDSGSELSARP
eukprot:Amastigsp_a676780_96.p5 type:complete len:158 gc:universal Amastigsp_a676780_96:778-1251(+)